MHALSRLVGVLSLFAAVTCSAADWPMWRRDVGRTAATSESLPAALHRQWSRQLPSPAPAWPEDPRLQFDASYEPIVAGGRMFVASGADDTVSAFRLATGERLWQYFAEGPVRFAPATDGQHVYFGADDGCAYCVTADSGQLVWKFQAAPRPRRVVGNDRLVSVWPVRGGVVLDAGRLYFTVGVWPFEGSFLYILDARTGRPTSGLGADNEMPVVLKDRSPQGYLALTPERILIPCGRAPVTALDRKTGEFVPLSYKSSSETNYHVAAHGRWLFHGATTADLLGGSNVTAATKQPVVDGDTIYCNLGGSVTAYDLRSPKVTVTKDRTGKELKKTELTRLWTWSLEPPAAAPPKPEPKPPETKPESKPTVPPKPPTVVHIKAGQRLYCSKGGRLFALDLPAKPDGEIAISWETHLPAPVTSLLAADGRLVAVTTDTIHVFGEEATPLVQHPLPAATPTNARTPRVAEMLAQTDVRDGFCVVLGADAVADVAQHADLRVLGMDRAERLATERERLHAAGLYGRRVALLAASSDIATEHLPPYLANLVVATDFAPRPESAGKAVGDLFRILRPYGGTALLSLSEEQHAAFEEQVRTLKLAQAEVRRAGTTTVLRRVGALPGSANWTHEYGDPANTLMSRDDLVRAPLGVLWFGGPASHGSLFYDRHYWGPSLTVIDGRMLIQGPQKLTAVDVYTGRLLWQRPLAASDRNNVGRRGNDFENVLAGFHFAVASDGAYVVQGTECLRLDLATGRELSKLRLPGDAPIGSIRLQGDVLVAESFGKSETLGSQPQALRLVALDRSSGRLLWEREANLSFPVVAVGPDKVFAFDGAIENFYRDWSRKGLLPKAADIRRLKAFDLKTGQVVWEHSTDMIVTWLGYSADRDVLIASNKQGVAAWRGKNGGELWQKQAEGRGFRGHPESLWDKVVLWPDRILDQRGPGQAYDLVSGRSIRTPHPVTGEEQDWEFTKTGHHCNYAIANPHLLTFRAESAGFCDIATGNTSRLEGFRSGCRNSLVPANGVLNSPNFASGCVCGYSLFTSLALVHTPQNEVWSYSAWKPGKEAPRRIGINFGGKGDRTDSASAPGGTSGGPSSGTLWVEHPNVTGTTLGVAVKVDGEKLTWFQRHASLVRGGPETLPWVAASGVEGATIAVQLSAGTTGVPPGRYRVRLVFLEPNPEAKPGDRVFDVSLQGRAVLKNFDPAAQAGPQHALVREFDAIEIGATLQLDLTARAGRAALSGIEVSKAD